MNTNDGHELIQPCSVRSVESSAALVLGYNMYSLRAKITAEFFCASIKVSQFHQHLHIQHCAHKIDKTKYS